eukprot:8188317-Alexandrium_andersonii.AAC.1
MPGSDTSGGAPRTRRPRRRRASVPSGRLSVGPCAPHGGARMLGPAAGLQGRRATVEGPEG